MKSSLSHEFQPLVIEPEGGFSPSKFLFGDNLSTKIKHLLEENKLIYKITVPRKQSPQKFKHQYQARQQSAKIVIGLVTEELFSNREIFGNKSKMPVKSRQKPLSFNRTEQNEQLEEHCFI